MEENNYQGYARIFFDIIGCAMEVHNTLGAGLAEPIYTEAMAIELRKREIIVETEKWVNCYYKGILLNKRYRMDLVAGGVVVELKSVLSLVASNRTQLFNYLRLTHQRVGLLINFGEESLRAERYGYDEVTHTFQLMDKYMRIQRL